MKSELFSPEEIDVIERDNPHGVTARKLLGFFNERGVRLTEATFRKYVQAGLLPRSRRVGRKGRHQGSQGLYPASTVRRLYLIKNLMAGGQTLEDIRAGFVGFTNHLDVASQELVALFDGYERELGRKPLAELQKKEMTSRLRALRVQSNELFGALGHFGSSLSARALSPSPAV